MSLQCITAFAVVGQLQVVNNSKLVSGFRFHRLEGVVHTTG